MGGGYIVIGWSDELGRCELCHRCIDYAMPAVKPSLEAPGEKAGLSEHVVSMRKAAHMLRHILQSSGVTPSAIPWMRRLNDDGFRRALVEQGLSWELVVQLREEATRLSRRAPFRVRPPPPVEPSVALVVDASGDGASVAANDASSSVDGHEGTEHPHAHQAAKDVKIGTHGRIAGGSTARNATDHGPDAHWASPALGPRDHRAPSRLPILLVMDVEDGEDADDSELSGSDEGEGDDAGQCVGQSQLAATPGDRPRSSPLGGTGTVDPTGAATGAAPSPDRPGRVDPVPARPVTPCAGLSTVETGPAQAGLDVREPSCGDQPISPAFKYPASPTVLPLPDEPVLLLDTQAAAVAREPSGSRLSTGPVEGRTPLGADATIEEASRHETASERSASAGAQARASVPAEEPALRQRAGSIAPASASAVASEGGATITLVNGVKDVAQHSGRPVSAYKRPTTQATGRQDGAACLVETGSGCQSTSVTISVPAGQPAHRPMAPRASGMQLFADEVPTDDGCVPERALSCSAGRGGGAQSRSGGVRKEGDVRLFACVSMRKSWHRVSVVMEKSLLFV